MRYDAEPNLETTPDRTDQQTLGRRSSGLRYPINIPIEYFDAPELHLGLLDVNRSRFESTNTLRIRLASLTNRVPSGKDASRCYFAPQFQ